MLDQFVMEMEGLQVEIKQSGVEYILTGSRHLLRILDIGLIVPELSASSPDKKIYRFSEGELAALSSIQGYPRTPILLELGMDAGDDNFLSVSSIKKIHFQSESAIQDFTVSALKSAS